ncbi:regulator [Streptomyces fragilis]|uniref:Regulator n=1 Tax=Streptomyces fragilis TaxID=67301 RepID=A0ABV2YC92_9ACTN|nr:regulator [Streptomyces fragilis]
MTPSTTLTPQAVHMALAYRPVIRLVSEIADHGAIPHHALGSTLSDLSRTQLRRAVHRADSLCLLQRTPTGRALSPAGEELADVYEATARWARRHNYPAAFCDFADRVHHALTLLTTDARPSDGPAPTDTDGPTRLLTDWLTRHTPNVSADLSREGRE